MSAIVDALLSTELNLLHALNTFRLPLLDPALQLLTNTAYGISAACLLAVGFMALWKRTKQWQSQACMIAIGVGSSAVVALLLKHGITRVRPFVTHPELVTQLADASLLSFPSGHTTVAFAMAILLKGLFPKAGIGRIAIIWAFAVAYSRMALGVHYPGDVLAGILTSAVVCSAVLSLAKRPVTFILDSLRARFPALLQA